MDFNYQFWNLKVAYDVCDNVTLRAGYNQVDITGHLDPLGVYSNFAEATGTSRFDTVDITQSWPELGVNWQISDNLAAGVTGKYFMMSDHIPANRFASPTVPALNLAFGPTSGAHPFEWGGYQIFTNVDLKF